MIHTKKELKFYIYADRIMNGRPIKKTILERICGGGIVDYLEYMRKCSFYSKQSGILNRLRFYYCLWQYRKSGIKYGFSIGYDVFGYGLVIPHGTIVVGSSNRIGNYAVLHTSTCISDNEKEIGDCLYFSTGSKMTSKIKIGHNVSVGANSVVNRSFLEGNCMIAGAPALKKKDCEAWYIRDGKIYADRVKKVESLKCKLLGNEDVCYNSNM